jgi:hypothetical protein
MQSERGVIKAIIVNPDCIVSVHQKVGALRP